MLRPMSRAKPRNNDERFLNETRGQRIFATDREHGQFVIRTEQPRPSAARGRRAAGRRAKRPLYNNTFELGVGSLGIRSGDLRRRLHHACRRVFARRNG
ncbi:hypothetical protein EVAR_45527_1 [Eumeta japonica]|uniref:Uncharacterized protein n=1 Tax=Eumeta variegata TaxID=151549 RepID=A0A4C1XAQ2_EUMVA|nr:hypothetical protein EVAR_45527_1 [Eumeta japonica]